ncbi:energy transducer TonB [Mucilaginibacter rubeus]|uniref:Energy transducer TonB n=1 Tax=Mucilaginibacter rubeus TaxID=2027860 RepID=A0AAE6JEI4_9SPHI|nr:MULTISPECIES: energy transducer TonB [Mucilaginibacter]QEM04299.1 energy transducer TonB [Mucilaginibacter rubeus]QEM16898.1 energy transducer TonB [Mucilaginibacter gossypii]QTE46615.1 energy transducer TonB [Mucilaginibacter rubeus]QTE53212.1 energy transducer TonB [Mucilaginibacter rubeus]QTE58300.1 energy transducer TonB [Mucilaginibacter rubeus]
MKKILPILIILMVSLSAKAQKLAPPHFRGGDKAFHEFLDQNLKWPKDSAVKQGIVKVSFYVESNGLLSDIKLVQGFAHEFDKEALRVINLSPRWVPATRDGKFIKSKYSVPILYESIEL